MKVWPVKHSPLLCQPERFIARDELKSLIQKVTHSLVNIHDKTGEFLLRLDDGRVIDTKGWAGWEWTHGVGLYGIWQYYCQTGDEGMRDIIDSWFADRFAEGATTKNVNTMSPFLTLAYRYEETKNQAWLPWLESWAEWAMAEMPVLPLAKIGKLLNKPEYVEEAVYQFLLHVQNLMDGRPGCGSTAGATTATTTSPMPAGRAATAGSPSSSRISSSWWICRKTTPCVATWRRY